MNQSSHLLRQRINQFRWLLPLTLVLVVLVYQLGLSLWVHNSFSDAFHFGIEILFFGTTGPLLAFWALNKIGYWLDEKESAEMSARANEKRLAAITSASADAIVGLNNNGNIDAWNRGAELMFIYKANEIIGEPLAILFGGGEAAELEASWLESTARESGFVRGHETACARKDGQLLQSEITTAIIRDEKGEVLGLSVILRDVTERKLREQEILRLNTSLNQQVAERTQQLAVKVEELALANDELLQLDTMRSEFVSLVSHQIRAPLTNVHGAIERMQVDCLSINPTCNRMFGVLEQQVERLDRLVQEVLSAARLEAGELVLHQEPLSISPVVSQIVNQFGARNGASRVKVEDKHGLPLVYADHDRIAEVLINLLDNADKYSPDDKKIFVAVRATQAEVVISVRDEGLGLDEKALNRVFEKFYRTDSSDSQKVYGYGLGLYICQQLIAAHGGHIWAENHPQGGAIFSFSLPVWQGDHD